jgi:hypothetical protein
MVEVRSRRPALLDAHDAGFGEMRDWWIIDITFAIATEDTQERENASEDSGTAAVYLLPTYLPPTGVDNGIH